MPPRLPSSVAAAALGAGLLLATARLEAQVNLTQTPAVYSSYLVGTQVNVTLEFCAYSGTITWQSTTIYFNSVDVTSEFDYEAVLVEPCANAGATDGYIYTGVMTIINGPNNIRAVWSTSQGSGDETLPYYATYAALVTPDDTTGGSQAAYTSGYELDRVWWTVS